MDKKKVGKIILAILGFVLLVIGVPLGINASYQCDTVIIPTQWGAEDVLSYYGTILSTTATAIALIVTITFTYKQIRRDSYLKSETEKWSKIESVFSEALNTINPIRSLIETTDVGLAEPDTAIKIMQNYQIRCRTAIDQLNAYLNMADYPKVKELIDAIGLFTEQVTQTTQKRVDAYSKLRDFNSKDEAKKAVDIETKCPNSVPEEILSLCKEILRSTNRIQFKDIKTTIIELNGQMVSAYQDTYRSLLQFKGSTFEAINTEIQKKADSILRLWGKS